MIEQKPPKTTVFAEEPPSGYFVSQSKKVDVKEDVALPSIAWSAASPLRLCFWCCS